MFFLFGFLCTASAHFILYQNELFEVSTNMKVINNILQPEPLSNFHRSKISEAAIRQHQETTKEGH